MPAVSPELDMTVRRASPPEPAAPAQKLPPYRLVGTHELTGFKNNPRVHSPDQVARIAASITEFGFTNPIRIDGRKGIIAGHGRLLAAQKLGLAVVPTIELRGLSDAQKRALVIERRVVGECPENGGMTPREVPSVGSMAGWGNADAMGVAVDCDRR